MHNYETKESWSLLCGWGFSLFNVPNFKSLTKVLMITEYRRGKEVERLKWTSKKP